MLRRRFLLQKPHERWDYMWDFTMGIPPMQMTYSAITFYEDGVSIARPILDLGFGYGELEIVSKFYEGVTEPQYISASSTGNGVKVYPSGENWWTNVSGKNESTGYHVDKEQYQKIVVGSTPDMTYIKIDESVKMEGPGVKDNQYVYYTGIFSKTSGLSFFRSIKFRRF